MGIIYTLPIGVAFFLRLFTGCNSQFQEVSKFVVVSPR